MIQPRPSFSPYFGFRKQRALLGGAFGLLTAALTIISWGCSEASPIPGPQTGGAGGMPGATGGTLAATGGSANTGGTPAATGGTPAATGGTTATGGASSTGGFPAVPGCVTAALTAKCTAACHSRDLAPFFGGLDLSGDFLPRLLDKPATYMLVSATDMPKCIVGAKLIDSTTPANSVFLKKINKMPDCGTVMPQSGADLTDEEKSCLQAWVQTF